MPTVKKMLWGGLLCSLCIATPALALDFDDLAQEGEIKFFSVRPDPGAYWFESKARIDAESLKTGLVAISTCHHVLDPNRKIVIAFNPERVESLKITQATGMDEAQLLAHTVELRNVQRGGTACIEIRSRALEKTATGTWKLHAGPLMRRYLGGYLPMQAKLNLQWPQGLLRLVSTSPTPQPGVTLKQDSQGAVLDMTFAGALKAHWEMAAEAPAEPKAGASPL